jgi:beta-lactam-binding protein with PASTA domain
MNRQLKIGLFNLLAAVVVVIALIIAAFFWLNSYTRHGEEVEIPDVKGITFERAKPLFSEKNLDCIISDSVFSKSVPAGTIVETLPPVGSKVKKGRTVQVVISSLAARLIAVPDVQGQSQKLAEATLRAYGFERLEIKLVAGQWRELVEGLELSGRPLVSGEKIPADSRISLLVSSGEGAAATDDSSSVILPDSPEENWF